ncbi:hypothetical protein ABEG17_02365 [Pedococcus sp. KACC 23699]|uniref:TRASH domain-containing protein n=1 Tax=Pedococcus sp. KACC 23699 TaxID=3149228 RepID=A0AAU7JVV2_9MICO
MPTATFDESDLVLAARVTLLFAVRPFPEGFPGTDEDTASVIIDRADALALASALRPGVRRNRFFAALRHLSELAASAAAQIADDTGQDAALPALALARHSRGEVLTVARYNDEDAVEDAVDAWDRHLVPACLLDRVEVEIDEVLPAILGIESVHHRALPASAVPGLRLSSDDQTDETDEVNVDDVVRPCPGPCGLMLPASTFRSLSGGTRYHQCRSCMREYRRSWAATHPGHVARYARHKASVYEPRPGWSFGV